MRERTKDLEGVWCVRSTSDDEGTKGGLKGHGCYLWSKDGGRDDGDEDIEAFRYLSGQHQLRPLRHPCQPDVQVSIIEKASVTGLSARLSARVNALSNLAHALTCPFQYPNPSRV